MVHHREDHRPVGVHVAALIRIALAALALVILAGCSGGDKIEPSSKGSSGSPILNREKGAQAANQAGAAKTP